jgi:murein DD-endopeptidase MepM/ murein hydrolase activator NlpD
MKPTKKGIITFPYGVKYRSGAIHKGTDFRAKVGDPVYAAVAGVVVHAGKHVYKKGWGLAFGLHVIVDNVKFLDGSAGLWAGYCHLSEVKVKVGQKVKQGDIVGLQVIQVKAQRPTYIFKFFRSAFGHQLSTATPING